MNGQLAQALAEYRAGLRQPDARADARPRRGRRRWVVGVLSTLVLAGGLVAWRLAPQSERPVASPPEVPATTSPPDSFPTPSATPNTGSVVVVPVPSAAPLAEAPATRWRVWSSPAVSSWLPEVDGAGGTERGGLAGFARSPQGALAAAGSLYPAIYYTRDRSVWRWLADERVLWAPDARAALAEAMAPTWSQVNDGVVLRPVGFRMLSWSGQRCQVRLWWRVELPGADPATVGAIVTVAWAAGDWWLEFDEPAQDLRGLDPARDGYLPWGPGAGRST